MPQASITFVVRVRHGEQDRVSGIVERVKTGEKHRFHGAEAIGTLIAEMLRQEARDTPRRGPMDTGTPRRSGRFIATLGRLL